MAATTAVAVTALPTSPVHAAAGSPGAAVVEIPDDNDVPPPGWDQWASAPVSAPEALAGALVARGDVSATLGHPADGVRASSSRARPAARLEQEREHADAPPAHFIEAQAEKGLWQELHDHSASLNQALNEAFGSTAVRRGASSRLAGLCWVSRSPLLLFLCSCFL
jgi:hypothetical protein